MTATSFLMRAFASYFLGISLAAVTASLSSGSALLLTAYSLAVGAPFFAAAALAGLVFRKVLLRHPAISAAAIPLITGVIWYGLGMSMGELFDAERIALYAIFCAATCAGAFWLGLALWPPR
ncbi:MAG: hypothetical protein ACJ8EH_12495 [Sphingomicrobium sp.]